MSTHLLFIFIMPDNQTRLRADAQRNYNRLLQSARSVFNSLGNAATLENIAKTAGVGIGTLYRHFPTRQALLETIYADKIADLIGKAPRLLTVQPPDQALFSWLKLMADYSVQLGGFNDLMSTALKDKNSPIVAAGSKLLTKAQTTGALRQDISLIDILRLINGIVADTSVQDIERTDRLLSVIMDGLKAPSQKNTP